MKYDVVIIGGGPAGLAAAIGAFDSGCRSILLLERENKLGGILNQCIHNGFGLHIFGEELTGPEYAARFVSQLRGRGIEYKCGTTVLSVSEDKVITAVNQSDGLIKIQAKAVVLAMGCRERSRGALNIPGSRPAGVYSAGTAQKMINIEGKLPGRTVVILGSGDIGLIMARRLTLEGAKVLVVAELMPYSGGLKRNIVQCLDDYEIPLKLSHTVIGIQGKERVTGVTIAEVDENRRPIMSTAQTYQCDTLLLSCGLIPENELTVELGAKLNPRTNGPVVNERLETTVPGVFAAGNVLHVHDLADNVSDEARRAGQLAAEYAKNDRKQSSSSITVTCSNGVRYTVPTAIDVKNTTEDIKFFFRVTDVLQRGTVVLSINGEPVVTKKRPIMAPGEMEQVTLPKVALDKMTEKKPIQSIELAVCVG